MAERVYYNFSDCEKCEEELQEVCSDCIYELSKLMYDDIRKIAKKADKLVVIAHNSNWRHQTGYRVLDLDTKILNRLINASSSFSIKVYREGRNFYAMGYSHDVPTGGKWELKPVLSNGKSDNEIVAHYANK